LGEGKENNRFGRELRPLPIFKDDFQFATTLGLNALTFFDRVVTHLASPSSFSEEAINHYRLVVNTLRGMGLKPFLTLHHFTNPVWFPRRDGWARASNIDFFLSFVKKMAHSFKKEVNTWLVINEPLVYIYNGYIEGVWPPGKRSLRDALKALKNMMEAYC